MLTAKALQTTLGKGSAPAALVRFVRPVPYESQEHTLVPPKSPHDVEVRCGATRHLQPACAVLLSRAARQFWFLACMLQALARAWFEDTKDAGSFNVHSMPLPDISGTNSMNLSHSQNPTSPNSVGNVSGPSLPNNNNPFEGAMQTVYINNAMREHLSIATEQVRLGFRLSIVGATMRHAILLLWSLTAHICRRYQHGMSTILQFAGVS